jgi:valyl-tRNA synthetase
MKAETKMNDTFLKPYDPASTEDRIYKKWIDSKLFNPDECIKQGFTDEAAEHFSIVLPPPNVTGQLHTGHAYMLAIEDIAVRYNRMIGKKTLWLPGTDHAAIATQSKVEKLLAKEKIRKADLGREEFLNRVNKFASDSHSTITNQVKKMGSSIDWSREAFTLDAKRSLAVRTAFKNMYDAGLIYRGDRIVNWDPKGQTTISDDEIIYKEENSTFYYFKYGPFTIGTSRPETKFGDKYVVMHPEDKRYSEYSHGQEIEVEWVNGKITATIIKDEAIDMEFGTGVMTITPWHSTADFEIAERHNLAKEQVINMYGKMLPITGEDFDGLKILEAREKVVEKLREKGLVEKEEPYTHNVSTAERTGGIIEPQIMRQWFIDVNKEFSFPHSNIEGIKTGQKISLKEMMIHVVKSNQTDILPEQFEKVYYHWIENLRDWCISRQIWYGHQIPVWYKDSETYVGITAPEGEGWEQDPDTLDTWFSSGLWTFSTLGWPEETDDMATYHPTTMLETGYDIIFFWVARMILMTGFHLGSIPFKTVYMHGLVRDGKGRKMSKSLGNAADPLDYISKYSADALRLALIIGSSPGNDTNLSEDNVRGYKKFGNKIWNATRFVLESVEDFDFSKPEITTDHQEYITKMNEVFTDITDDMENFRYYLAADKIYHYFWHTFADVIIEECKKSLNEGTDAERKSAQYTLYHILTQSLKVLHPFVPFVTEEIWSMLPEKDLDLLMVEKWPIS